MIKARMIIVGVKMKTINLHMSTIIV